MKWLVWQLGDSAFPVGGFAHSAGLEAAVQLGEVEDEAQLRRFLRDALWQAGHGSLPLVGAAHDDPQRLAELDALCDAFLTGAVANRASRTQGRALLSTCSRAFAGAAAQLDSLSARCRALGLCMHQTPLWGVITSVLGVDRQDAEQLFLHLTLRSLLSAAIRLGLLGPLQAQHEQFQLSATLQEVQTRCSQIAAEDVVQTAPLIELFQSAHDRLYSRLFLS